MAKEIIVLDMIDETAENAPDLVDMRELLLQREKCSAAISEATARRVEIDAELGGMFLTNEIEGIQFGQVVLYEKVNKGRQTWDTKALQRMLTPDEIEKARKRGKGSVSVGRRIDKGD